MELGNTGTKFLVVKHYTAYKTSDYLHNCFFLIFGNTKKFNIIANIETA